MRVAVFFLACFVAGALSAPSAYVDPALRRVLKAEGSANIFISFKAGTSSVLADFSKAHFADRAARLNGLASALQAHAQTTQENVITYLNRIHQAGVKPFWINNKIFIENADTKLVDALSNFPEIAEITEEIVVQLDPMLDVTDFEIHENRPRNVEWGVEKIQAEAAWSMDGGNSGDGIVVSNIDTGVRYTHEALRHNFRSSYGWYDPYQKRPTPVDEDGHGTHTMGTIAGANGIGVAPGVTWMACLGCTTFGCSESALIGCGQFIACPHLPDESEPDCSQAPDLVSNSWGGGQGDDFYAGVVAAWRAANIVPLFSAGNSGPYCGTANSPGDDINVIGVGSTTISDALSSFSSKGPSVLGKVKPDVSAPGSDVYSSYADSDTSYRSASGTSMACPHAAGVVALLKSRKPNLTIEEVKNYLIYGNAQEELIKPGQNCGNIDENTFPNHAFGHGRINAFNSLNKLNQDEMPKL